MKTREDRPAEAPFDPRALGVHRHVDHAAEKPEAIRTPPTAARTPR